MKILYIMSVPWGWIKQRPHFIAEELSKKYQVEVYCKRPFLKSKKRNSTPIPTYLPNLNVDSFQLLPFHAVPIIKHLNLKFINRFLMKHQLPSFSDFDILWVTSPYLFSFLKDIIPTNIKVVYDCMDDYAEFDDTRNNKYGLTVLLKNERELLQRANQVFCSAEYLKNKVFSRAGMPSEKAVVVNNAIGMPSVTSTELMPRDVEVKLDRIKNLSKSLVYVGTIAEWFDFDLILKALERDKDLNLVLIGPIMGDVTIPVHERIHFIGPIQRNHIFAFMEYATALVMPFKVIELVKSVNPVKLYEYIFTGKPVIAPRYGETEKFGEFVSLYENLDGFMQCLSNLKDHKRDLDYKQRCYAFVSENTWTSRARDIEIILNGLLG